MASAIGILFGLIALVWLVAAIAAGVVVLVHAFRSSVAEGLLYLFVPFYSLYYLFAKFQHPKKVLVIVLLISPIFVGTFASFAIYGVRKYIVNAKKIEGRQALTQIVNRAIAYTKSGMEANAGQVTELPACATPVPRELASISGMKYMSAADEWQQGTWGLIGYSRSEPQYFQYQWERLSPTEGVARAIADLDGNGAVDVQLELAVRCVASATGLDCHAGSDVVEVPQ